MQCLNDYIVSFDEDDSTVDFVLYTGLLPDMCWDDVILEIEGNDAVLKDEERSFKLLQFPVNEKMLENRSLRGASYCTEDNRAAGLRVRIL